MGHPFYVIKSFLKDPNQSEEDLQQSKIIKLVLVIKNILKAIKICKIFKVCLAIFQRFTIKG